MSVYDLAVIGAGAAGLSVTAVAAQLGLRVALIERDRMGGDCLNGGCVPSKALLAAAGAAEAARRAAALGVHAEPAIDWEEVRGHVGRAIAALAPMDSVARFAALGAEVIRAEARFVGPDALEAGGRRLRARRIVVAAGSRADVPEIPGLAEVPHLTNATLFEALPRPEHLLVIGGGPMGLEIAQAFRLLGCRVTVVEAARLAGHEDVELVEGLAAVLRRQGVDLVQGVPVAGVVPGPALLLGDGQRIEGSHLLVATGRRPNIEGLGLEAGGVRASERGIATDRGLRSVSNRRVFAAGDIADPAGVGPRGFTHVGSYHAGIVIRRALFRLPARLDYAALPRVIYTDPELAQVGLTETEARAAGHEVRVLRWPLADTDRAVAEGRPEGLAKLAVTKGGRVLGAGILAPHAGEMIGAWGVAIGRKVPLSAMAGMMLPYPTRAEAAQRAARQFFAPKLLAPATKRLARWLARLP
jgi:pyruvate/2-oxoglutarate dehydrogenase complex dihydrolipoamide dehydrogenase (E3) component